MILLLGGNGFVGSAFKRLFEKQDIPHILLTRSNYEDHIGKSCDIFINANGNSKKFMADRDPAWEFDASVHSVSRSITEFNSKRYIHLSTGDVYPKQDSPDITNEDDILDPQKMSRYGLHKYLAETLVRGTNPNHLVFRMGGFVGPGLKKNAIFDMLNNDPVWLDADSQLQFISTDKAASIIWELALKDIQGEIFNLGARGTVRIGDVYQQIGSKSEFKDEAKRVQFEINVEKLAGALDGPLPSTQDEITAFIDVQ